MKNTDTTYITISDKRKIQYTKDIQTEININYDKHGTRIDIENITHTQRNHKIKL